jgi:hypothetical protein
MTNQDYLAAFNLIVEHYRIKQPKVMVKRTRKGTARYRTWSCTLPIWPLIEGEEYATYYAIHEAVHFVVYSKYRIAHHSTPFKKYEREALALFDLEPVYKKAYPKALRSNGQIVWRKK